jgi:hypothetical protein
MEGSHAVVPHSRQVWMDQLTNSTSTAAVHCMAQRRRDVDQGFVGTWLCVRFQRRRLDTVLRGYLQSMNHACEQQ